MGKNTNFTGQPLYAQLLKLTNKGKILELAKIGNHNRYVKKFDAYTHFVIMLFAVLKHYDSIRELVVGLLAESNKLSHLGIGYMLKRSTFSEANNRRSSRFFATIYTSLYLQYKSILADSSTVKEWEKRLFAMDSTTITLFSNILKGAGRNPKHGKKKGGIKAHTVIKVEEFVPMFLCYTSAATHDHFMLKALKLPAGSIVAFDRAYVDYDEFERLTLEDIVYVTKAKKNLVYQESEVIFYMNEQGLVVYRESTVVFTKGETRHRARRIEYWDESKKKTTVLLTNDMYMGWEDVVEIYKRRWQIELLFKQLKQNFQLRYFYGESVNAIESQIWVVMIANLLLTVLKNIVDRQKRHKWSFSCLTTAVRQMLMYYIDMYAFLTNPEKAWLEIIRKQQKPPPKMPYLFDWKLAF